MRRRPSLLSLLLLTSVFSCSGSSDDSLAPDSETGGSPGIGGALPAGGSSSGGAIASGGQVTGSGGFLSGGTGGNPQAVGGSPASSGGTLSGAGGSPVPGGAGGGPPSDGGTSSGGSATGGTGGEAQDGCPFQGKITYTLARAANPTNDEQEAYERITAALDKALSIYNCYTQIEKHINAQYNPSVPTADGNPNGSIRFGSRASMNFVTAMHEISHVLGVGADGAYDPLIVDGVYTGPIATARLRELTGDETAEIHGDGQHFWPYGLNYESEYKSEQDGIFHCYIVTAIRQDIGWD